MFTQSKWEPVSSGLAQIMFNTTATSNAHTSVATWAEENKEAVQNTLAQYGAIRLRDFPVHTIRDLEQFAGALTTDDWVDYVEASSPRDVVESKTSTSTKYDNKRTIFFHNEKSHAQFWPLNLFFYCVSPASSGGQTPVADCRAIYSNLPGAIREKFAQKKLMYVRQFSKNLGIPWQKAFNVQTPDELESYCKKNAIDDVSWNDDGTPTLRYIREATVRHPVTGDNCWSNHGTFFNRHSLEPELKQFFIKVFGPNKLPYNTFYGDGSEIEPSTIDTLRATYLSHATYFDWREKDILFIDNISTAHGRTPYDGKREVLVTMTGEGDSSTWV